MPAPVEPTFRILEIEPEKLVTLNMDIHGLVRRLFRFGVELFHSQSNGLVDLREADRARLISYLDAADAYIAWAQAQPQADMPETHPHAWKLDAPILPTGVEVENDSLIDILSMIDIFAREALACASTRQPNRFTTHDEKRFKDYITRVRNFVTQYIDTQLPLDLPESTPQEPVAPPGQTHSA